MARTTAGQLQFDLETYLTGTLSMTAYPSDFDSVAQVLAPATEYFSVFVQQVQIARDVDSNVNLVRLVARLRLLYRFTTNEAEYTGSGTTPTKQKAALAAIMDDGWWNGKAGLFNPTQDVHDVEEMDSEITRTGRVIETEITVTLVTTSV